jgi:hypothetical protein
MKQFLYSRAVSARSLTSLNPRQLKMNKTLMGLGILAVAAVMTSTTASASPCVAGNNLLSQYVSNPTTAPSGGLSSTGTFSCQIAPLTFSNFSYLLDAGSFAGSPINVSVEAATLIGNEVNLEFNPNLTVSSSMELEDQVTGGILGVDLGWNGSGTGFVNEVVCTVFTMTGICPSNDQLAILNVNSGGAVATPYNGGTSSTTNGIASVVFAAPHSEVWIFKDIGSGNAPYTEVEQSYLVSVPEPMTFSLLGAGLLSLGLMRRRRNNR